MKLFGHEANLEDIAEWHSLCGKPKKGNAYRWTYRFDNHYGASIINSGYGADDGLYELAVLKFGGTESVFCYDNVLGGLSASEVNVYLSKIKDLDES